MLDIFSQYATDPVLESEGAEFPIGVNATVTVARSGNRAYFKLLNELVEKNQAVLDLKNDLADEKSDEIMVEVMAQTILLGWNNVGYKGKPLDYSKDNARLLLKVKDFRKKIAQLADTQDAYKAKLEEEQAKN